MDFETDPPVAFERDTLDVAVQEVMRLAAECGQATTGLPGTGQRSDLRNAGEVRNYLIQAAQAAYAASGHASAGSIRKIVYRSIGVVFEPISPGELGTLEFAPSATPPVHVAQFWQRLG